LFENPYIDPSQSVKIVGNADFMKAGYDAQLKSIVLLKNKAKVEVCYRICLLIWVQS